MFFEPLEERRVLAGITLGTGGSGAWALDPTLNGSGTRAVNVTAIDSDFAWDVAIQTGDGKIVAVGQARGATTQDDFAVVRYNPDGSLDTSFDGDGIRTIDFSSGNDVANAVAIDANGKIVLAGTAFVSGMNQIAVVRLNSDGTLDGGFDTDGKVTTNFLANASLGGDMAIQADGKIVVVATIAEELETGVVRFNANGSLDTSFGTAGKVQLDIDTGSEDNPSTEFAAAIVVQPDQRILLATQVTINGVFQVGLARLNTDGSSDTGFSGDGKVITALSNTDQGGQVNSIALQPDGKILAAGTFFSNVPTSDVFVVRYDSAGALDTGFGVLGEVVTDLGADERGWDVAVQDGKIVVAGSAQISGADDFLVLRYTSTGAVDTTFTPSGRITTDFSGFDDSARALAIDGDGKIVLAGLTVDGSDRFALARYAPTSGGGPPPTFTLDENGSITLNGSYTTTSATATITIDWGDNTAPTSITVNGPSGTFSVPKQYLDDVPTNTAVDINTITATIQDGSGSDTKTTTATVSNLAPAFVSVGSAVINENGTATITGSFSDVGTLDTHTIIVNWGDSTSSAAVIDPLNRTFTATKQYLDDNPTVTASDVYNITLTLTDDDTGAAAPATATVTVNNVAPAVDPIGGPASAVRGQSVAFAGSFTDVGMQDTHQVFWDFGDGTQIPFQPSTNPGALAPSHTYANAGTYTVTLTVKDDDTGTATVTRSIAIVIAQLEPAPCGCGTALVIGGTEAAESIFVSPVCGGVEVFINSSSVGVFNPSHAVVIHAYGGNDEVQVSGWICLSAWIYGGAGDDRLKGGGGNDVILGQAGHDLVVGGANRDILIGGTGQDRIVGNSDDDILISGTTDHDGNQAALCAILAEWNSSRCGYVRIANIYGCDAGPRLNGNYFLNDDTVHDDGERDLLTGSSGFDWFFANLSLCNDDSPTKDRIVDQNCFEIAIDIDFIES